MAIYFYENQKPVFEKSSEYEYINKMKIYNYSIFEIDKISLQGNNLLKNN